MIKHWALLVLTCSICAGCTTVSLDQYAETQNQSATECTNDTALDCLATVAGNPWVLPSYSLLSQGVTTVTDSYTASDTFTVTTAKPSIDALSFNANRQPRGQWTVDPSAEYERLEALHATCLWMLFGPAASFRVYPEILGYQADYLDAKPHFGVTRRLSRIPPRWFGVGKSCDVPKCARYSGHCGNTWVWVMSADTESFAQFKLALLDIASLDMAYSVYSDPLLVGLTTTVATKIPDPTNTKNALTISTTEWRMIKKEYKSTIEYLIQQSIQTGKTVDLTLAQWLAFSDPWYGTRTPAGTPSPSVAAQNAMTLQVPAVNRNLLNSAPVLPAPPTIPLSSFK